MGVLKSIVSSIINPYRVINQKAFYLGNAKYLDLSSFKTKEFPPLNFLIMGAMKAGTTSLYHYLEPHPEIFMSNLKEPGYLLPPSDQKLRPEYSSSNEIREFLSDEDLMLRMMKGYQGQKLFGEASTHYTKVPEHGAEVPKICKERYPDMKFIYLVRNPFKRIVSQYLHSLRANYTQDDFNQVIREDELYISISLYYKQLKRYLAEFDRNRFLILFFEDLIQEPQEVMKKVYQFLEVAPYQNEAFGIHNKSDNRKQIQADKLKFSKENHAYFMSQFEPDLAQFSAATGVDVSRWDLSAERLCK